MAIHVLSKFRYYCGITEAEANFKVAAKAAMHPDAMLYYRSCYDKHVLDNNGNWVALTLAMVIATNFLAQPIAPLFLAMTEKMVAGFSRVERSLTR